MTITAATCEVFVTTASNGDFLNAYSPAKFDKALVAKLKNMRGAYCRKDARGFRWEIAADHICADDFRQAFEAAAARGNCDPKQSINLAYEMYNKNGAFYG
ncbi:hypothetical protein [Mesorhizobium sp. CAU 1741]|uniref:hypothetical protein n=1 Tax=Mesorhizobium sp. CAU 1741 TaxID=3140366 RepID=UPI00325A5DE8